LQWVKKFRLTCKQLLTYYPRMVAARQRARFVPPAADVFHAVADPTRRRLLDRLARSEAHVNALAAPFRISRPAVSQHLRILRDAGLVVVRRCGRERLYRLEARRLREVYDWVAHYERFWKQKLAALREFLDREGAAEGGDQPTGKEKPNA
jgi:DNA-binding transcriptional ArsR family regulator